MTTAIISFSIAANVMLGALLYAAYARKMLYKRAYKRILSRHNNMSLAVREYKGLSRNMNRIVGRIHVLNATRTTLIAQAELVDDTPRNVAKLLSDLSACCRQESMLISEAMEIAELEERVEISGDVKVLF